MINVIEEWKPAKYYRDTGETEDWSDILEVSNICLLYTSPSPRDRQKSRMPSSA